MSSKSNFPGTGEPQFARFVTDSDEMITAGSELVRYRISDGKAMATQRLAASLSSFAISEDRSACAISYKGLLEIRDTRSLQLRVSTSLTGAPESIRFSHDGGFLAVRESARLCVFRTVDLQQISEMECADQFSDYDVLWLPDGRIAATCDGGIDLFDPTSRQRELSIPFENPDSLPATKLLIRAGRLGVLSAFDYHEENPAVGCLKSQFALRWSGQAVLQSSDGWLIVGDISGWISILNSATGTLIRRLRGHASAITSLDIDPTGRWILSVDRTHEVRVWNMRLAVTDPSSYRCTGDEQASIDDIAASGIGFTSDGKELRTAQRGALQCWSIPDCNLLHTQEIARGQESVQYLSDAEAFAGLWMEENPTTFRAWLFDLKKQLSQRLFDFPCRYPKFARVNRAKTIIATFADSLMLLDYSTGLVQHSIETHGGPIEDSRFCGLAFSPDDRTLFTAGRDGTLHEWNPNTGEVMRSYQAPDGNIESFAISPDGSLLAISEKFRTVIFDVLTWKPIRAINHSFRVHWSSLAITADHSKLAFATTHKTEIQIFCVETGKLLHLLRGHTSGVHNVCWSPRGDFLATTSDDQTLKLWQIQ